MKKFFLAFAMLLVTCIHLHAQRELIINTTGNGFDRNTFNGVDPEKWTYIQKFANLTYNGQDASVTAVRLHIPWDQYEPTLGNYHGTKLAQAVAAIIALKPGMKVALHFHYQRPGPQPGQTSEGFLAEDEISRIYDGTKGQQTITYTLPSIYSQSAKTKFYNYVSDALSHLTAYYSNILYVEMGNGAAEEYHIPVIEKNGGHWPAFYEDKALQAWRTEYLPCRYPGQTTVTWNGTTQTIASAPSYSPGQENDWNNDHGREYHRFAAWGLMNLYKGFRDVVKSKSSSLKVLYFISHFGSHPGNLTTLHNSTIPMALTEFDGIYHSDGTTIGDSWRKIMAFDVIKGTNANKIAANEFDPEDLGEQQNPKVSGINTGIATEWMSRSYKHGADYVHLAMFFDDNEINQLAPALATIRANFVNGSYSPPARQTPISENIYPNVFTGTAVFQPTWDSQNGGSWAATDLSPKSVSITDNGYWENIWSCSTTCDFSVTASSSNSTPAASAAITLTASCTGGNCIGVSYSWSGNGISGSGTSVNINAPATAGTYTYTVTASKSGCSNKTANVSITVPPTGCDFNMSASASPSSPAAGASVTLSSSCSGANCTGLSYSWSGNGISGIGSSVTFNAPSTVGTYTYTLTTSKSGCSNKTTNVSITIPPSGGCGFTEKGVIGTWSGFQVQTRQYTVNGSTVWLVVTAPTGSSVDKHFPRGANFVERTDISWSGTAPAKSCFGGGETGYNGLVIPSGITIPAGYGQFTEPDGAVYFAQTCTAPAAPTLSANPASVSSGASSTLTATGCSGGTVNWSHGLGTGNTKTVNPTNTTTYTATCTVGTCTSASASVTVTVIPPNFSQCIEAESSNGNGAVTSDPNASNGETRGEQSNYNHYVDYVVTNVPAAGTYNLTLRYYSSAAPVVSVQVNGGTAQTVNLANSQSWNIVWVDHTLSVSLTAGTNTIRIQGTGGGSCRQDRICVTTPSGGRVAAFSDGMQEAAPDQTASALKVYPNPSHGQFEVRFYLEKGKKAILAITDAQGRTIQTRTITGNGQHKETIHLARRSSGTLFVQLRKDDGIEVKKVLIIK